MDPENLNVPMANASQPNGNVITRMTVVIIQMRLSALKPVEVLKKPTLFQVIGSLKFLGYRC